jgi:hypothetical protein
VDERPAGGLEGNADRLTAEALGELGEPGRQGVRRMGDAGGFDRRALGSLERDVMITLGPIEADHGRQGRHRDDGIGLSHDRSGSE